MWGIRFDEGLLWSNCLQPGTPSAEIIATLQTVGLSMPTSGLEEVFSKIDCRSADDNLAVVQQRAVCQDQRPALEALVVSAVRAETDRLCQRSSRGMARLWLRRSPAVDPLYPVIRATMVV